jgi:hypothetical protein
MTATPLDMFISYSHRDENDLPPNEDQREQAVIEPAATPVPGSLPQNPSTDVNLDLYRQYFREMLK